MSSGALTGAVLSRLWRVGHKLGDGGMGEVYAAEPAGGGARVAIKILRQEFLPDAAVVARFLEEGRTCIGLIHPNIVRVFECAEAEDRSPYIVMELLEGVPLSAYTARGGRVPPAQAVPILHGILGGLAAAHARGVIHRDLKPDNVFLTRDQAGMFAAKLLDFGLAKVMDAAGGMGQKTRTGMLLGTPAYMSPEQIKNARDVDPRADLFSAGVLFYEMVSGRAAFPAPTEFAKMTAVLTAEPEPLARIDPALAPFASFVERALKKERDERFPSAIEMARALSAVAPSTAQPQALSRLPDVASVLAPSAAGAPATFASPRGPAPSPSPPPAVTATDGAHPRAVGDTLSSPVAKDLVVRAAPEIPVVKLVESRGQGSTLPSEDLPIVERSPLRDGVAPLLVVGFVAAALVVGFLLGWTAARM
jgi:eukaryotic-like serine/threonine-protein kinase